MTADLSIRTLINRYRVAAEEHTRRVTPRVVNRRYQELQEIYRQLRDTSDGRQALAELLSDPSPAVRCWAAAHCLTWTPEQSVAVLEALIDAGGKCTLDAYYILDAHKNGECLFPDEVPPQA